MVSIGKGDVGASKLTGEVLDVMERLPKTVEGLTGVDITKVCCHCVLSCGAHGPIVIIIIILIIPQQFLIRRNILKLLQGGAHYRRK